MSRVSLSILLSIAPLGAGLSPCVAGEEPRRVDQTVADVDPLGTSLRQVDFEVDLRQDIDFQYVYTVPGHPDSLMRRQGGLVAVFNRSDYLPTWFGPVPVVPPNTVFYVGEPPAPPAGEIRAPGRLDTRVYGRVSAAAGALRAGETPPSFERAIHRDQGEMRRADMSDEPYRRHRLREITDRAIERLQR
ncbi:MAG: hypothetical protein KDA21_02315 [Phycisphaerales bacterium]|nr:hypothetical protein [Phycisphaerales bacterium]